MTDLAPAVPIAWSPFARHEWLEVLNDLGYAVFEDSDPSSATAPAGGFAWSYGDAEGGVEGRDFSRTFPTEHLTVLDALRAVRENGEPQDLDRLNRTQVRIEQTELRHALNQDGRVVSSRTVARPRL